MPPEPARISLEHPRRAALQITPNLERPHRAALQIPPKMEHPHNAALQIPPNLERPPPCRVKNSSECEFGGIGEPKT